VGGRNSDSSLDEEEEHLNEQDNSSERLSCNHWMLVVGFIFLVAISQHEDVGVEKHRAERVRIAYDIVNLAIDAFKLVPQVEDGKWPMPMQLREIGGNTKDAIAFLSFGSKDNWLDQQRMVFEKEAREFVNSIYRLADMCASYSQGQHSACTQIRTDIILLNGAFCAGDYEEVIRVSKVIFTKAREAADDTRLMRDLLGNLIGRSDNLRYVSRTLAQASNRAVATKSTELARLEGSSLLWQWWNYAQFRAELASIHGETEYMGFIIKIANATAEGLKQFQPAMYAHKDMLDSYQRRQDDLVAKLEEHLRTNIPDGKPNSEECRRYHMMTKVFLTDLDMWDELRSTFLL